MGNLLSILALAIVVSTQPETASLSPCDFDFVHDPETGRFVAVATSESCRDQLIANDLSRLVPKHKLGRIMTGAVSLSSASVHREAAKRGVRAYRWHVRLPEGMNVPASVSTRFTRIESTAPVKPARILKCNITSTGFDLIVVGSPRSRLHDLQVEWVAYEFDPPATPLTCNGSPF